MQLCKKVFEKHKLEDGLKKMSNITNITVEYS